MQPCEKSIIDILPFDVLVALHSFFYPAKYKLRIGTVGTDIDYARNKVGYVGIYKLGSIDPEH